VSAAARVLKWNIPVDDRPHSIGGGPVVLVACQHSPESVQVWTHESTSEGPTREVQVYGTGQPLVGTGAHVGSVVAVPSLVWHVYERVAP
jgi:hypothetical protein